MSAVKSRKFLKQFYTASSPFLWKEENKNINIWGQLSANIFVILYGQYNDDSKLS